MIPLEIKVSGVENLREQLGVMPLRLRAKLVQAIGESVKEVATVYRAALPQGKTGRTKAGVTTEVREFHNAVRGSIAGTWYIARFLEGGVHGTFDVRKPKATQLKYSKRYAQSAGMTYRRTVNIPARRYLQNSFNGLRGVIEARIAAAIESAVAEGR